MEDRKVYIDKMALKLKEWDNDIQRLEEKSKSVKDNLKAEYQQKINEIKTKREEVKGKLAKIQDASEDAWIEIKSGLEHSWNILDSSIKNALSKFSSEQN